MPKSIQFRHFPAVYRFVVATDEVRILAIRLQREVGFLP
jgi:hypothetical protein